MNQEVNAFRMTRELAEKIMNLNIEEQRIMNEKYEIRKMLGLISPDQVTTAALKFLLEESHVNA